MNKETAEGLLNYLNTRKEVKRVFFNKEETEYQFHQHEDSKKGKKEQPHPVEYSRKDAIEACKNVLGKKAPKEKEETK